MFIGYTVLVDGNLLENIMLTICLIIGVIVMLGIGASAYYKINEKDKPKDYDMKMDVEVQKKIDEINKKKIM